MEHIVSLEDTESITLHHPEAKLTVVSDRLVCIYDNRNALSYNEC